MPLNQPEKTPERKIADKWADYFYQHQPKLNVSDVILMALEEQQISLTKHEECLRVLERFKKYVEKQYHSQFCPQSFLNSGRKESCNCGRDELITTAEQYLKGVGR